jgi:hypothetical protein
MIQKSKYFWENLFIKFTQVGRNLKPDIRLLQNFEFFSVIFLISQLYPSVFVPLTPRSTALRDKLTSTTEIIHHVALNQDNQPPAHYHELTATILMNSCNSHSPNSRSYNWQTNVKWINWYLDTGLQANLLKKSLQFEQILLRYCANWVPVNTFFITVDTLALQHTKYHSNKF